MVIAEIYLISALGLQVKYCGVVLMQWVMCENFATYVLVFIYSLYGAGRLGAAN